MTARAQALLDQLRELPLAERTELEQQLHTENAFEQLRHIEREVEAGRMPTHTEAESNARARQGLEAARAERKA